MGDAAGQRSRARPVVVGVIAAAALLPRALTTGRFQTADEPLWMARSWKFSEALRHLRFAARTGVIVGATGVAVVLALWPAIWADPVHQFSLLRDSAELASTPHRQFFLGEITRTPGPAFYLVALPPA